MGTDACSIGVATDPDCLGPCEPGTNVLLEGIVWQETENGKIRYKCFFMKSYTVDSLLFVVHQFLWISCLPCKNENFQQEYIYIYTSMQSLAKPQIK